MAGVAGGAPMDLGGSMPDVTAAQGPRERPRGALPPLKRFRAPDLAQEQAAGAPSHDQVIIWIQKLNAQREIDNAGWRAMEVMINSVADRIEALEDEDLQYNDKINLTAEHSLKITKGLEQKIEGQMSKFAQDTMQGMVVLEKKLENLVKARAENDQKVIDDARVLIKSMESNSEKVVNDASTLMSQMEAQITAIQGRLAALDQQTEQNRIDIAKNGRVPLIQPQQPQQGPGQAQAAETYSIHTPQKSAMGAGVEVPQGIPGASSSGAAGAHGGPGHPGAAAGQPQQACGGMPMAHGGPGHPGAAAGQSQQACGGVPTDPQGAPLRYPPGYGGSHQGAYGGVQSGQCAGLHGGVPGGYGGHGGVPVGAYQGGYPGAAGAGWGGAAAGVGWSGAAAAQARPGSTTPATWGTTTAGPSTASWPPPTGSIPSLKYDSRAFETKVGQESKNQYDGGKGGEAWKVLIRGYLLGKAPMMGHLLKWAEDHGSASVTMESIGTLVGCLDEDPFVIGHLLWAFLNVNLTHKAREVFCNVPDSHGFEAWRRIHRHIYATTERRQDELYHAIHNPKAAQHAHEVAGVLEDWDTNQRLFGELGGVPLREDELKNLVLKIVPEKIRDDLIFKIKGFKSWLEIKDYIKENARMMMNYSGKAAPVHLADTELDEATMAKLDDMPLDQALEELGEGMDQTTVWQLVERRQQRRSAQGRFVRRTPGPTKPRETSGREGPMSKDGKPMCANCGAVGHHKGDCPHPKAEPGKRPCFKCGKPGHTGAQCKSGLPAKVIEPSPAAEQDDEGSGATVLMVSVDQLHPRVTGARHFIPEDTDDDDSDGEYISDEYESNDMSDDDDFTDNESNMSGEECGGYCCRRGCTLRGLRCIEQVFSEMAFEVKQVSQDVQGGIGLPADEAAAETSGRPTRWRRMSSPANATTTTPPSTGLGTTGASKSRETIQNFAEKSHTQKHTFAAAAVAPEATASVGETGLVATRQGKPPGRAGAAEAPQKVVDYETDAKSEIKQNIPKIGCGSGVSTCQEVKADMPAPKSAGRITASKKRRRKSCACPECKSEIYPTREVPGASPDANLGETRSVLVPACSLCRCATQDGEQKASGSEGAGILEPLHAACRCVPQEAVCETWGAGSTREMPVREMPVPVASERCDPERDTCGACAAGSDDELLLQSSYGPYGSRQPPAGHVPMPSRWTRRVSSATTCTTTASEISLSDDVTNESDLQVVSGHVQDNKGDSKGVDILKVDRDVMYLLNTLENNPDVDNVPDILEADLGDVDLPDDEKVKRSRCRSVDGAQRRSRRRVLDRKLKACQAICRGDSFTMDDDKFYDCESDTDEDYEGMKDLVSSSDEEVYADPVEDSESSSDEEDDESWLFKTIHDVAAVRRRHIVGSVQATDECRLGNPLSKEPQNAGLNAAEENAEDKQDDYVDLVNDETHEDDAGDGSDFELEDFDMNDEKSYGKSVYSAVSNMAKTMMGVMMKSCGGHDGRYRDVYDGSGYDPRQDHCAVNLLDSEYIIDINVAEAVNFANEFFSEIFEVALDSGAGEHVANNKDAPHYKVEESAGSRAGQNFIAANNHRIPNRGQMTLALRGEGGGSRKGREIKTTFQVATVSRPLWSVGRICDEGYDVKFMKDEALVMKKDGTVVCRFERRGGLYIAKMSLRNPLYKKDFRRQAPKA